MDLKTIHIPKILFLNGCYLSDCDNIEDMFDDNLLNELDVRYDNVIEYNRIPQHFISLDTWIKKTNIKCWNCDCSFDSTPIFIPTSIIRSDIKDNINTTFTVHGNFCSFSCATTYLQTLNISNKWDIQFLLRKLYYIFYNKEINNIPPSPSKYMMKQYGGHMEVSEYMECIKKLLS